MSHNYRESRWMETYVTHILSVHYRVYIHCEFHYHVRIPRVNFYCNENSVATTIIRLTRLLENSTREIRRERRYVTVHNTGWNAIFLKNHSTVMSCFTVAFRIIMYFENNVVNWILKRRHTTLVQLWPYFARILKLVVWGTVQIWLFQLIFML